MENYVRSRLIFDVLLMFIEFDPRRKRVLAQWTSLTVNKELNWPCLAREICINCSYLFLITIEVIWSQAAYPQIDSLVIYTDCLYYPDTTANLVQM